MKRFWTSAAMALLAAGLALGCGRDEAAPSMPGAKRSRQSARKETESNTSAESGTTRKFAPVQLGDDGPGTGGGTAVKKRIPDEQRAQAIVAALQPFQILLGDWRWGTFRKFGDFTKTGDDLK
ncbi:MAG: hypothetical protein ACM3U2_22010 [Deltaproteobacteria bacterium]